ncbi:hypothetical protein EG68_02893 [Paragonimus skrjabini miyazakii]|uniref:Uncharacterized protein n=1 Tax=Paragonimus skrjabini miyazakii TaxID=59628 RepID=A0A8S9YZH0_9TREM|nr:hypothetical protein EG68_02893 [Paragonimus skrjabini miyazakii]
MLGVYWDRSKKSVNMRGFGEATRNVSSSGSEAQTSTPSLNPDKAATKIQAGYRGYRVRKLYHTGDCSIGLSAKPNSSSPYGTTSTNTGDRSTSISPVLAATRIQAGYRGYKVRKGLHHENQDDLSNLPSIYSQYPAKSRESTEADKAAAKIQASFRGYMTRRALLEQKLLAAPRREMHTQNERNQQETTHSDRTPVSTVTPLRTRDSNLYSYDEKLQSISNVPSKPRDFSGHYHSAPQNRDHKDLNEAAAIIQAGFRGYQTRKALHSSAIRDRNKSDRQSSLDRKHNQRYKSPLKDLNKENAEQAATRIQATYRGFVTRKKLRQSNKMQSPARTSAISEHKQTAVDPNLAATKIQAAFRGFTTRQKINLSHE